MSKITDAYNHIRRASLKRIGRFHQRYIEIPVHGSCPMCHHFHINCLVPHDLTAHTRIRCERCGHQMFGLGRSTTQYTLASVNTGTMITPHQCVEEQPLQAGSQGETVAVEDAQDASLHSANPNQQLSFAANQVVESPEQSQREHIQEPRRDNKRNRLKQWCLRLRKWNLPIRAMKRLSNAARGPRPPTGPAPSTANNNSVSTSSPPSISQNPPEDPAGEVSESVTRPKAPSSSHQMNQPGEATRERLRILRQEKTKQRERELRPQCLCSQKCFCRSEGSGTSNVAYVGGDSQTRSYTHTEESRSPPQETNGSSSSQGISRETTLSYMGHQFVEHMPSSLDTLALTAENPQRRSMLSQTPTIDPNESSITLSGRMPGSTLRNVRHRSPANSYNETSRQIPAERGMAGASESNRHGLASAGLPIGAIPILEPDSISHSQASFGSSPRHDSHVDYGYTPEGTSLQVDGIASEYTAEEASEEDTPPG